MQYWVEGKEQTKQHNSKKRVRSIQRCSCSVQFRKLIFINLCSSTYRFSLPLWIFSKIVFCLCKKENEKSTENNKIVVIINSQGKSIYKIRRKQAIQCANKIYNKIMNQDVYNNLVLFSLFYGVSFLLSVPLVRLKFYCGI